MFGGGAALIAAACTGGVSIGDDRSPGCAAVEVSRGCSLGAETRETGPEGETTETNPVSYDWSVVRIAGESLAAGTPGASGSPSIAEELEDILAETAGDSLAESAEGSLALIAPFLEGMVRATAADALQEPLAAQRIQYDRRNHWNAAGGDGEPAHWRDPGGPWICDVDVTAGGRIEIRLDEADNAGNRGCGEPWPSESTYSLLTCGDGVCDPEEMGQGRSHDGMCMTDCLCELRESPDLHEPGGLCYGLCRDGVCDDIENRGSSGLRCSRDCMALRVCGDYICDYEESSSCPGDCSGWGACATGCLGSICGDTCAGCCGDGWCTGLLNEVLQCPWECEGADAGSP